MKRLLVAALVLTVFAGCDDDAAPAGWLITDADVDAGFAETDAMPVDVSQEGVGIPAIEPLDAPDLNLEPESEGYEPLPATELAPDALPQLEDHERTDRLRFADNNRVRASWLTVTFGEADATPIQFDAMHSFMAPDALRQFEPEVHAIYVDALAQAGATGIVLPIGVFPWLTPDDPDSEAALASYDAVLDRAAALDLAVRLRIEPSAHSTRSQPDWASHAETALALVGLAVGRAGQGQISEIGFLAPTDVARALPGQPSVAPERWGAFINAACARAATVDPEVGCTATLDAAEGWPYVQAALASDAQRLGVSVTGYTALEPETWIASDRLVDTFRRGMTADLGSEALAGRGFEGVFLAAVERPAFPITVGRAHASSTAGLGCIEYNALDAEWLEGVFAYAKARSLAGLTLTQTTGLVYLQGCGQTLHLYESVAGDGQPWANFQHGNPRTDPLYRTGVAIRLITWDGQLSLTGEAVRKLMELNP
jgi:hypothetical protein